MSEEESLAASARLERLRELYVPETIAEAHLRLAADQLLAALQLAQREGLDDGAVRQLEELRCEIAKVLHSARKA